MNAPKRSVNTIPEIMQMLDVSAYVATKLVRTEMPYIKFGRSYLVHRPVFDLWFQKTVERRKHWLPYSKVRGKGRYGVYCLPGAAKEVV